MLDRRYALHTCGISANHGGQARCIFVFFVVQIFIIGTKEPIKLHHRTCCPKGIVLTISATRADVGCRALQLSTFHLAGDGALPNQIIKRQLISFQNAANLVWVAHQFSGANSFMRFLRILGL